MPAYARGRIAWGQCQRCGLRYLLNELVMDGYFPNIRVCAGCYDAPQPQERLVVVSDPVALWRPALDTDALVAPQLTVQLGALTADLSTLTADSGFATADLGPASPSTSVYVAYLCPYLTWTSIGGPPVGSVGGQSRPQGGRTARLSAGYQVYRSTDGGQTFAIVATLRNQADEFGALSIEQLFYYDSLAPAGNLLYYVRGFDVAENAENE